MHNFLITGMGRSGTRFLAETMNLSERWTVGHEPGGPMDARRQAGEVQKRFDRNYYGEVNSYLRFYADQIEVEKRGVILRNPIDLWLSITTWHAHKKQRWSQDLAGMKRAIPHLLKLAESGRYRVILFDRMISNVEHLRDVFADFGIDDVEITEEMLRAKVNAAPAHIKRTTWDSFNAKTWQEIVRLQSMYIEWEWIHGKS